MKFQRKMYDYNSSNKYDSVMKMNKKNYPQVYLEECKMVKFIDAELDLDDSDDSLDSNAE